MKLFWFDSETTHLSPINQQMLSFAMICTNLQGEEIDSLYLKIKLRSDVNPSSDALKINRIDPYDLEWVSEAVCESTVADSIINFVKTHKTGDSRFLAYNAKFDISFFNDLMIRYKKQNPLLSAKIVDPSFLAKELTQKNIILTPKGKSGQRQFKLEIIAEHLNSKIGDSHNALFDTKTMISTTLKMAEKINQPLEEILSNPKFLIP